MLSLLEKKYLNLLNIAFCDNFTKLSLLFNQYNSFEKILQKEINLNEKIKNQIKNFTFRLSDDVTYFTIDFL